MSRSKILHLKIIANEFSVAALKTLEEKNFTSESQLANEMLNLLLKITKSSGDVLSENLLNLSRVLVDKICLIQDARWAFRKSDIFREVLLVYPHRFLPQFESLFNEAVKNFFCSVSLEKKGIVQQSQKILEILTDKQFQYLLDNSFSNERIQLFNIYQPAYLINSASQKFNKIKQRLWNKTKLSFYGSVEPIKKIQHYKNLKTPKEKIQFIDCYIDFSVKSILYLNMNKKLREVTEHREDLLQDNPRALFLQSLILDANESLFEITPQKLDELFLMLSQHPLRKQLTELEYVLALLDKTIFELSMAETTHFQEIYSQFTKQFTVNHEVSFGLSQLNRLSFVSVNAWIEQIIIKNQFEKVGQAVSRFSKKMDGLKRLHSLIENHLLSSVRAAQNISPKLILKYFKKYSLSDNKNISQQDFLVLEKNISSDKEKLQLLTYLLSKIEIYGPPEHAKASLEYHLFDKNLFFRLITVVASKTYAGIAKQVIAIHDDHLTKDIDLQADFGALLNFLDQNLDYETNLFKTYRAITSTEEKEKFRETLQLKRDEILKGKRPDQNHFLTLGAATQAIPVNSRHLNSAGVKKMFEEGIHDDHFLRESLKQYMPEVIDPSTDMSYEIHKSLKTIQKVKTRDFSLIQLEKLLSLRTKKTNVTKMLKSTTAESLKESLRALFIKKEFSTFEKIYRSFLNNSSVGLTLMEEFIYERAKNFIIDLMVEFENSQSEILLKSYLDRLNSLLPDSKNTSLSLFDFFSENHLWLWDDLIAELNYSLNSFEEKIISTDTLSYQMGKNAYLALCGGVADVCIANDYELYKRSSFNLLAVKDKNKYLGFLLLYFVKENDKNILIVGGVEPGVEMLEKFSDLDVYYQMMEALIEFTQKTKIDRIGLLNVGDLSNRKKLNDKLLFQITKKLPRIRMTQSFNRIGKEEENQDYFLLWEKP